MSGEDDLSAVMGFSGFGKTKMNNIAVHLQIDPIVLSMMKEGKRKP